MPGPILRPGGFRAATHAQVSLGEWISLTVDPDLRSRLPFSSASASATPCGPPARAPPAGSDFGDLLVTRAQVYTLCHDEVCRQMSLHCAPLAGFSVKLWAALAGVADAALRAYEDAHAECVEYRAQLEQLTGSLSGQLGELRDARSALGARLERAESAVVDLRARLRAAGKETALALEEAAGSRSTAFAAAAGVLGCGSGSGGSVGGFGEARPEGGAPLSASLFSLLTGVEAADNERRRQGALAREQRALAAGAWALCGGGGALRWGLSAGACSVGVQAAGPGGGRCGGGARARLLVWALPIPPSPAPRRAPDVPFEWRAHMSVFDFERPPRRLPAAAARRAQLQLLLDKGSFDRAALPTTGVRLSLAQFASEFFNHKFGLPTLADQHATRLLLSIRGARDLRARLFDALACGTVSRPDGRPLLGQAAFDFLTAVVDDFRRAGALRDHVAEHEGAACGGEGGGGGGAFGSSAEDGAQQPGAGGDHHTDGGSAIPIRLLARTLRTRFHFAPREFVVRLLAPLTLMGVAEGVDLGPAPPPLEGPPAPPPQPHRPPSAPEKAPLGDALCGRPHSGAGVGGGLVDVDSALRLALLGWVEAQVAWEARIATAFDRYSVPGVPVASLRARDMGVTAWESGPGEGVAAAALARAAAGGALARGDPAARSGLHEALAAGMWGATALRGDGAGAYGDGEDVALLAAPRLGAPGRHGVGAPAPPPLLPPPLLHYPQLHAAAAELGSGGSSGVFLPGGRVAVSDLFTAPDSLARSPAGARSGALAFNMEDKRRRARCGVDGGGGVGGAEAPAPAPTAAVLPTFPLAALYPPGWPPGLGVAGALAGARAPPPPLPVFRPEDVLFADVDAYADNRWVRDGCWRPGPRRGRGRAAAESGGGSSSGGSGSSGGSDGSDSSAGSDGGNCAVDGDALIGGGNVAHGSCADAEGGDARVGRILAQRAALRAPLCALDSPLPLEESVSHAPQPAARVFCIH
jgi:hypothetical protein